jgi:hypothetical protein
MDTFEYDVDFRAKQEILYRNYTEDSVYVAQSKIILNVLDNGSQGDGLVCSGLRAWVAVPHTLGVAFHDFDLYFGGPLVYPDQEAVIDILPEGERTIELGGGGLTIEQRTDDALAHGLDETCADAQTINPLDIVRWIFSTGWDAYAPSDAKQWYFTVND